MRRRPNLIPIFLSSCKQLTGALIVRDSRATEQANETYLDMLEDYFAQPTERLAEDLRPELGYQVVSRCPQSSGIIRARANHLASISRVHRRIGQPFRIH